LKILLTGANGFIGSHVLDTLRARELPAAILLRPSANRRFIQSHLSWAEVRTGAITDPASLGKAMAGITHVIHCAGCTRAGSAREFHQVNATGTANVVQAANAQPGFRRLVQVSSLAASGPANPAREPDHPHPVSDYGMSKLAAELEVRRHCRQEFVILRPPAVYGPRDVEFLRLFQAVKAHLRPRPSRQPLSLVFAPDLARTIVTCLDHPAAAGKTYFAASPEVVTARAMAAEIAAQMGVWAIPVPLPALLLWPLCLVYEIASRITGRPSVLSLQKFAELRAPAWVCDPGLIERETGCACPTALKSGIGRTLEWYRQERWL
jgi:nucleoside-diphosphate-sugar epimerase